MLGLVAERRHRNLPRQWVTGTASEEREREVKHFPFFSLQTAVLFGGGNSHWAHKRGRQTRPITAFRTPVTRKFGQFPVLSRRTTDVLPSLDRQKWLREVTKRSD